MDIIEQIEEAYFEERKRQDKAFAVFIEDYKTHGKINKKHRQDALSIKDEWFDYYCQYYNLMTYQDNKIHLEETIKESLEKAIKAFKLRNF